MRRAERLERDGRPASALAIYASLLPLVSRKDPSLVAAIERRRADCLLDLGRIAEAFTAYNKSLDANPSDLDPRCKLAQLLLAGSAPDKAFEYAQVYLRSRPQSADALAVVGGSLAAIGRIPDAVASLQKALRLDPHSERLAIALADLYSAVDQEDDARRVLEQAVKSDPAHSDAWLALGRLEERAGN